MEKLIIDIFKIVDFFRSNGVQNKKEIDDYEKNIDLKKNKKDIYELIEFFENYIINFHLYVYDILMGMYENDYYLPDPEYLWRKTPDEIMQHIIASPRIFDFEYGWEQLEEEIRDYLTENDFIVSPDDVSDEEYQQLMEGRTKNDN